MLISRRSLLAGAGAVLVAGCRRQQASSIVFADVSRIWWNANPIVAMQQNGFADQPFSLSAFEVATGRESLDAVNSGNADVGMAAGSVLLFAANAGAARNVKVLASIVRSDGLVGIVNDVPLNGGLPSAPIGFVPNTVSQYVLKLYSRSIGRPLPESLVQARPGDLPIQFANGSIRSFVCWEPYPTLAQARASADHQPHIERPRGLFKMDFFLFANRQSHAAKADSIARFIGVLERASVWSRGNRDAAIRLVAQATGLEPRQFAPLWDFADLRINRDRNYLAGSLEREARVAHSINLTESLVDMSSLL
jgi:ABC-type nitrate/sulfonate/bicarbonate transport system substrate-binding protein